MELHWRDRIITLAPTQVHGDKTALRDHPESVHIYVQKGPRQRRRRREAEPWRTYKGRSFPPPSQPAPTVFQDRVYGTVQHAFLACLLWCTGGASGLLHYDFPPLLVSFPTVTFPRASELLGEHDRDHGGPGPDQPLAVHLVAEEPTHGELVGMGRNMLEQRLDWCLLLVGTLSPVARRRAHGGGPAHPQLRGILCRGEGLCKPLPWVPGTLVHGWSACLRRDAGTLVFARDAQDGVGALVPAVLPALSSVGFRLWRRSDAAHAIVGKREAVTAAPQWDARIRHALEDSCQAAAAASPPPPPQGSSCSSPP